MSAPAGLNAGLTAIPEDEVARHLGVAQGLVTRFIRMEAPQGPGSAALAGTGRRFVQTVSTSGLSRTRDVELQKTIAAVPPADPLLSPEAHALLYRVRRGLQVGLAVAASFARQSDLEALQARNVQAPLAGADGERFRVLLSASAYVAAFAAAAYVAQMLPGEGEAGSDPEEPDYLFDTPQEALKSLVASLDRAISACAEAAAMLATARRFARLCLLGLIERRARFSGLAAFAEAHVKLEGEDFALDGFDIAPGQRRKALVMTFRKPEEIIGNAIAKYQAMRLARMLVAYDFERQMNPFVELGGFLFTFIGDGMPGTGKTMLIQMLAGLINEYCQMAGYGFHYENFGVDQISSYQGKSGQNCKAFVNGVMNPRQIGFGTIDDVDQVAARRNDDRASAGQQEVTAVLMESFAGASTVVRGNCCFGMFSNYPENVDDALRQRAGARWLVDGPQSREDYIDIFASLVGSNHQIPPGNHPLFAGQAISKAVTESYAEHARPQEEGLVAVWERFSAENGGVKTLEDIGTYLHRIRQVEPRFTGRAIKNIVDAIRMRAMDVDLPDDWFQTPGAFLHRPYDEKKAMISALRGPVTIEMVLQEINRYADSEFRYTDKSDSAAVTDLIRRERQRERAMAEIETMKRDGRWEAGR
nr:AAA family ATPase [uncultured Gellertiella sp.]